MHSPVVVHLISFFGFEDSLRRESQLTITNFIVPKCSRDEIQRLQIFHFVQNTLGSSPVRSLVDWDSMKNSHSRLLWKQKHFLQHQWKRQMCFLPDKDEHCIYAEARLRSIVIYVSTVIECTFLGANLLRM
jgi:hypothetical protein